MNIEDIIFKSTQPPLYEKGTAFMWTDDHISKQLLNIHLNPEIDLASRKMSSIQLTVDWLLSLFQDGKPLEILDLGCGPGLYSQRFARQGHHVTGVDISKHSIDYAVATSREMNLGINYLHADYLELELPEKKFDLVTMIYTDLGVLEPHERAGLIKFVYRVLGKGGMFVFDVLSDKNFETKTTPKTWEALNTGFWRSIPHLVLSESFAYPEEKVILYQHMVLDESDRTDVYRFWTHFFSHEDMQSILDAHGFTEIKFYDNILPAEDIWTGNNVIFCAAIKG
jgi:SAM-dependent methyltransferase